MSGALSTVIAGEITSTTALSEFETGLESGSVPDAVAIFVKSAVTPAAVQEYAVVAPAAMAPMTRSHAAVWGSLTATPVRGTSPVFVTVIVNV
ncbi:MAG: hypothetical protein OEM97_04125, partial [Acidimicrobiia bacterium]|nr:hypothetical protein [Acidimicrobiia bacterium]